MKSSNINRESQFESSVQNFKACVSPSNFTKPNLVFVTKTSYKVSWDAPENDGGCPIIKYEIYRDWGDGANMDVLVNTKTDTNLEQTESSLDTPPSLSGKRVWLYIKALNEIGNVLGVQEFGEISSSSVSIILADKPGQPTPPPQINP